MFCLYTSPSLWTANSLHQLGRIGGVLLTLSLFFSSIGMSKEPSAAPLCQALPEDSSSSGISLHVAKAPDSSGIICVRAINGKKEGISYGVLAFRLQNKEGRTLSDNVFQDEPDMVAILTSYVLQPGDVLDRHLPGFGKTVPLGRYRACFRFSVIGQSGEEEVCSQEFSLP